MAQYFCCYICDILRIFSVMLTNSYNNIHIVVTCIYIVYMHMYVCMHVCVYVCVAIYCLVIPLQFFFQIIFIHFVSYIIQVGTY